MKVEMIQRPGRTDEFLVFLIVMGVLLTLSVAIVFVIQSSKPKPEAPALFSHGERITVRVNNSSGIIKKISYGRGGWAYDVRLAVGMEVMEFSEDELAKGGPE